MRRPSCLLAGLSLVLAACPGPDPVEPPHLLYGADPQSADNPFPDGRLLTGQGFELRADWYRPFLHPRALTPKMSQMLNHYTVAARDLTGFGNFGPTLLRSSEPLDPGSLSGAAARLVREGGGWAVLERDVPMEHARDALEGTGKTASADYPEFVVARPSVPLPEDAEGMLVLLRGPRTAGGVELGRGFDFDDEPGAKARAGEAAAALGVDEADVLLALPLRPARGIPTMKALATWTAGRAAPAFEIPARGLRADNHYVGRWQAQDAEWNSLTPWLTRWPWSNPAADVGEVVAGTFRAHDLREAGIWKQAWIDAPEASPQVDLTFILTLPAGPKPAGGWPVAIGGHGMNGRNTVQKGNPMSFCMEVAQALATAGHGCLGIDAVDHGGRGSAFDFFAVEDLRRARDNFRQTAFDMMQLASVAKVLDVDGDGVPDLSPQLGYFGNSLGGIMGGNIVALDDRVRYGVLNVPGGGLANVLTGDEIRDRVGLLVVAKTNINFESLEYYSVFPLFRAVGQLFLEPGDPVNLGRAFQGSGRALLIQEGVNDHVIPNFTTAALAHAMGAPEATAPAQGTSPLRVHSRIEGARHGLPADYNGHNVFWDIAHARTQVLTFLSSSGTTLVLE